MRNKKIGILGGTFDPIHSGHIAMAEYVLKKKMLDEVWLMPAGKPPWKKTKTKAEDRMKMIELAIEGKDNIRIEDIEYRQNRISYTSDTIYELKKKYVDGYDLYFLMGVDSANRMHLWENWEYIAQKVHLIVFSRDGKLSLDNDFYSKYKSQSDTKGITIVDNFQYDISSTGLRGIFSKYYININKADINNLDLVNDLLSLIPKEVLSYIENKGLYKE